MDFIYNLFKALFKIGKSKPTRPAKQSHYYYRLTEDDAKDVADMLAKKHAKNIQDNQGNAWTAESEFQ